MTERGKYIVIEGHDGTGKSRQVELLHQRLEAEKIEAIEIHEPAGAPIADELRTLIKNGQLERDATTNVLLFTAARRELWRQKIAPALGRGAYVLAARSWLSTVAYQGYGEGFAPDMIEAITKEYTDPKYLEPDFACVLSLEDEAERTRRIGQRGELKKPDTFESRGDDFQDKVKQGYLKVALKHNLPIIDASRSIEKVYEDIWERINEQFAA